MNTSTRDYPPSVTQNFMNSCQLSGGGQELCSCVLEEVEEKYSLEEFSALEIQMQAGQAPNSFYEFMGQARAQCQ